MPTGVPYQGLAYGRACERACVRAFWAPTIMSRGEAARGVTLGRAVVADGCMSRLLHGSVLTLDLALVKMRGGVRHERWRAWPVRLASRRLLPATLLRAGEPSRAWLHNGGRREAGAIASPGRCRTRGGEATTAPGRSGSVEGPFLVGEGHGRDSKHAYMACTHLHAYFFLFWGGGALFPRPARAMRLWKMSAHGAPIPLSASPGLGRGRWRVLPSVTMVRP